MYTYKNSGKRLKASTMYSRIKTNRPAENSFLFHQNVRIKKPVLVCTTYFKFGRKWSFRCTPQNVSFPGLPAHNIDYNMP
jgi:hypothetical protein